MSIEHIHLMGPAELRKERQLSKNVLESLKVQMRGQTTKNRMKLERDIQYMRDRIDTLDRRLLWFERKTRTQPSE
jgi:hypothetical protein